MLNSEKALYNSRRTVCYAKYGPAIGTGIIASQLQLALGNFFWAFAWLILGGFGLFKMRKELKLVTKQK